MGCVSSKRGRSNGAISPVYRSTRLHRYPSSTTSRGNDSIKSYDGQEKAKEKDIVDESLRRKNNFGGILSNSSSFKKGGGGGGNERKIGFSFRFGRQTEGEHVGAGWPAWLTSVAGGAVEGWLPLKSERFERLEKIGQGTYSSVYRARDLETGKMVAIKKIRFDNFQRESVRFMAREISILRKLDHPNVMKLEGIITSRLSVNIYLVFEYMEHDLSGLLSCPDIKFTESQIKCYMMQLLSGLEHCHSRGIMHRDIKTSNILVNNEGILKLADFGLANFVRVKNAQPLTNRVVTLWYRPPELLLGSTNYNGTVDLWSAGCVFVELFTGRALLKGRTEVEQLHKIFKLCGSPPDEFWKRSKLPLANIFKPQQPYDSMLQERFQELPEGAVNIIETFLSVDPSKRGTAADALVLEYFNTMPYPCNPSSMPKYPPNKEIDAKFREEARRRKLSGSQAPEATRNPRRVRNESCDFSKLGPMEDVHENDSRRNSRSGAHKRRGSKPPTSMKQPLDTTSVSSQLTALSQDHSVASGPIQMPSHRRTLSGQHNSSSSKVRSRVISKSQQFDINSSDWAGNNDSYNSSDIYHSQEEPESRDYVDQQGRIRRVPHLIRKIESRQQDTGSHQPVHRSRFYEFKD